MGVFSLSFFGVLVFFCVLVFFFLQKKQEKHKKVQETKENIKNDPHTIFL